jgi:hypothetical protein
MIKFSIGNYMMQWVTGPPKNNQQLREYLERFSEAVRLDEREILAQYLERFKLKTGLEFDAHIDYLNNEVSERPDQLHLNLD